MNKLNKKGFTLIEMLVVIAIIAVLVSIIIPTVTSATDKAAAATNAANLRSIKAEVVTAMLTNDSTHYTFTKDANGAITGISTANELPAAKKCGAVTDAFKMYIDYNDGDPILYFSNNTDYYSIKSFADFAEGKDLAKVDGASGTALSTYTG